MKIFKKTFLSVFDWVSLIISLGLIIFIVLFVSLSKRNYTSLQSSINDLSKSGETVKVLQNVNRNLLLSENNFRIFLSTGNEEYKSRFLNYIYLTIEQLKQIQKAGSESRIDSIILILGKNIQISNSIEYLKEIADSVSNKAIKTNLSIYNGKLPVKKIDASTLEKYFRNDTVTVKIDSSINTRKRTLLQRLFSKKKDDVKISVAKKIQNDSASYSVKDSSKKTEIDGDKRARIDSIANSIQQFYKSSIAKIMTARQESANNDEKVAFNNLLIINNIDAVLEQVINSMQKEDDRTKKEGIGNATKVNTSNLNQAWWISATILFAAILLVISAIRIFKKTEELNIKNNILKKKNDISARLISIINHDIMGPLKFIIVVSKNLAQKEKIISQELKTKAINDIVDISEKLESIAKNILNWMKYQHEDRIQEKKEINIRKLVDDIFVVLNPLSKQKNITLQNLLSANTVIYQHVEPLQIILYNIIVNAIKFSFPGKDIVVNTTKTATELIISVKDEGVGMTDEQIENILNGKFVISSADTLMNKGNGLGYLIIKDLLALIGGRLSIQSQKDVGSAINIHFPINSLI